MNAIRLSAKRDLANLLNSSRLRSKRNSFLEQPRPLASRDIQLKARDQDARDHGEHMFACPADGTRLKSIRALLRWRRDAVAVEARHHQRSHASRLRAA